MIYYHPGDVLLVMGCPLWQVPELMVLGDYWVILSNTNMGQIYKHEMVHMSGEPRGYWSDAELDEYFKLQDELNENNAT